MAADSGYIGRSIGENEIKKKSLEISSDLGLKVADTSWTVDLVARPNEYIFTIETENGDTGQLHLTASEIHAYEHGVGIQKINERLKKMLEEFE